MPSEEIANLNPDNIEINEEMLNEDIEIQKTEVEEDLVQDNVNEDSPQDLNEEGVEIENANENE